MVGGEWVGRGGSSTGQRAANSSAGQRAAVYAGVAEEGWRWCGRRKANRVARVRMKIGMKIGRQPWCESVTAAAPLLR